MICCLLITYLIYKVCSLFFGKLFSFAFENFDDQLETVAASSSLVWSLF